MTPSRSADVEAIRPCIPVPGLPEGPGSDDITDFLAERHCPADFAKDVVEDLRSAVYFLGGATFTSLNPYGSEIERILANAPAFSGLPGPRRRRIARAVSVYRAYMKSSHAPDAETVANALLDAAWNVNDDEEALTEPTARRERDHEASAISSADTSRPDANPASSQNTDQHPQTTNRQADADATWPIDASGLRNFLLANGLSQKNAEENVTKTIRARKILGADTLNAVADDLDKAIHTLTVTANQQGVGDQVQKQVRRALTYWLFYRNNWSPDHPNWPAQRQQNTGKSNRNSIVDRDAFGAFLNEKGLSRKMISDRLSRVDRIERLVGSETLEQAAERPFDVKDQLEEAISRAEIKRDVKGHILRAYRDYVHYLRKDKGDGEEIVLALAPGPGAKKSKKATPAAAIYRSDKSNGHHHVSKQDRKEAGYSRRRPVRRGKRPKKDPVDGRPVKTRVEEKTEQEKIQEFLNSRGVTRGETQTAHGARLLENLGFD